MAVTGKTQANSGTTSLKSFFQRSAKSSKGVVMKKVLFPLILAMLAFPSMAADEPGLPAFIDLQIQVLNDGKPVYGAVVLVARGQEVTDDTLKTTTMAISCSRG